MAKHFNPVDTEPDELEEGSPCPECKSPLSMQEPEGCSCHISPPCAECTSCVLECDECGWEDDE